MEQSPKFKYEVFNSIKKFKQFLKDNTSHTLILEDRGQDLQNIQIHSSGEILNCDFHSRIYNGQFVQNPKVGEPLVINGSTYGQLVVEKIQEGYNG